MGEDLRHNGRRPDSGDLRMPGGLIRRRAKREPDRGVHEGRRPADDVAVCHAQADTRVLPTVGVEGALALQESGEPEKILS